MLHVHVCVYMAQKETERKVILLLGGPCILYIIYILHYYSHCICETHACKFATRENTRNSEQQDIYTRMHDQSREYILCTHVYVRKYIYIFIVHKRGLML